MTRKPAKPRPAYCPTCLRTVTPVGKNQHAPRHNNLDTTKPCPGAGQPITHTQEPTPAPKPPSRPAKPANTARKTTKGHPAATRSTPKRARVPSRDAIIAGHVEDSELDDETIADLLNESEAIRRVAGAYPPKVKAQAVQLMGTHGIASTHDATGIPKPTLSRWAREANIDLGGQAVERTRHAAAARRAALEEARAATVPMLEQHLADFGMYLSQVARINAEAAHAIIEAGPDALERKIGLTGPYVVVTDPEAAHLADLALALDGLPLSVRDAEGVVTRAIHDMQLLNGEATERGEMVVEFAGIPRPRPADIVVEQHDPPELTA